MQGKGILQSEWKLLHKVSAQPPATQGLGFQFLAPDSNKLFASFIFLLPSKVIHLYQDDSKS